MLAMGCIKSLIIDKVSNGKVPIDMTSFLTQVVLVDLQLESGEPVSRQSWNYSIKDGVEGMEHEFSFPTFCNLQYKWNNFQM